MFSVSKDSRYQAVLPIKTFLLLENVMVVAAWAWEICLLYLVLQIPNKSRVGRKMTDFLSSNKHKEVS